MRKSGFQRISTLLPYLAVCCTFTFRAAPIGAQVSPQYLDDYLRRAREMEKREDYPGAERLYQEAASNYPNQPEILKRLGIIYQTELKFRESIETFERVLQGAPQYPEVNFYLGLSYFGTNQLEK